MQVLALYTNDPYMYSPARIHEQVTWDGFEPKDSVELYLREGWKLLGPPLLTRGGAYLWYLTPVVDKRIVDIHRWQPMSTAPREPGSRVLLTQIRADGRLGPVVEGSIVGPLKPGTSVFKAYSYSNALRDDPTHWAPIPKQ